MQPAPQIRDEQARLQALRGYDLLDTLPEGSLDDLTALAAHICGTPISLITIVDEHRQWFKSRVGLDLSETPRDISFCGHAIASEELLVIEDAAKDERFADNPLVTGDPRIRFYAGAPLVTSDGNSLGALCVMDRVPRSLDPAQCEALRVLGCQVMAQFELRRQTRALSDSEARMRAAVAAANVGLWDWDLETNAVWFSPEWKHQIGYEDSEISNALEEWRSRIHPEDLERAEARVAAAKTNPVRDYENEFRFRHKDGTYLWILAKGSLIRDAEGWPVRMLGSHLDITARKRSEQLLREREEQFRLYSEHSPAAVAMLDRDLRYLVVSRRWMEDYQLGAQSIIGQCHYDVFPEIPERWREIHHRCLAGASEHCEEDPFTRLDGSTAWLRWEIKPWHRADSSIGGIIVFSEDITSRKHAEAALRESEEQYRLLFANNPHPMWVYDMETLRFLAVNDAAIAGYGYSRDEFLAMTIRDIRPAEDIPQLMENLTAATGDFQDSGIWRHRMKSGDVISVEITSHKLVFNERNAELVLAMNVTSRLHAEQRLAHLNRVYAVLSDINQSIVRERDVSAMLAGACRIAVEKGNFRMAWIGMLDETGRVVPVSSAGAVDGYLDGLIIDPNDETRAKGPTSRALLSGAHVMCADIENDPVFAPWRERALERGYRASAALPLIVEGKAIGTFNLYASEPGFFEAKETQLLDELAVDISFALEISHRESRRRVAEEELRWRTAFFEAQVESALDGILIVDTEGRKILQNDRFSTLWKIPPAIATNPDDRVQVEWATGRTKDPEQFVRRVKELYASPVEVSRDIIELLDGTVLERGSSPVVDKAGRHYGRIWMFRDITEQRRLEAQFRQSQKMEAIGQLAGGIAHDFNNILAAIMMQADLASSAGEMPAETREMLEEIRRAAERAANLTRQLLAFSRRQVMQPRVLDLNEVVTNVTKMLQRILGEDIRLQFNLHPMPLFARADAGMLDQVLLNLVVNARDAMPSGGSLAINTKVAVLSEQQAAELPDSKPGPQVCVSVTDTGCGIPPEHLSRIFEPFFTTKEPGKGTGLGLATVFGIIKQHGGALKVESVVNTGTTIEFMLPAMDKSEVHAGSASAPASPRGGTETILLVEDDPAVRMLTRIVFENKGYRVLEADCGPAALDVWESSGGAVDLLFTDLVMPEGIGGHALAAELQSHKPGLKVIFTSGYSADIAGRELELKAGQNFIQKPSPPNALLEIVRRSLDS